MKQRKKQSLIKLATLSTVLMWMFFLHGSCRKDIDPQSTTIRYHEFSSGNAYTSVDSTYAHPSGCGLVPAPADSTTTVHLDIDQDGDDDFRLVCSSWQTSLGPSNPCAEYNTSIVLKGVTEDDHIAVNSQVTINGPFNELHFFEEEELLNFSNNWSSNAILMINSTTSPMNTDFNGDRYIGLKIKKPEGDYLAWMHIQKMDYSVTFIDYGIHNLMDFPIVVGSSN